MRELLAMGFPRVRAANALQAVDNAGAQQAVAWLVDNDGSPLLLDRPNGYVEAPSPSPAALGDPFFGAALAAAPATTPNPLLQSQQPQQPAATPPGYARQRSLGGVGVAGILRQEERRAAATDRCAL